MKNTVHETPTSASPASVQVRGRRQASPSDRRRCCLALLLIAAVPPGEALGASSTIIQVPNVVNGTVYSTVRATGINNSGRVLATGIYPVRSFVWDSNSGQVRQLPTLCPSCGVFRQNTHSSRINDHGDVSGLCNTDYVNTDEFVFEGFCWDAESGNSISLGAGTGWAKEINNLRQIAGSMPGWWGAAGNHAYVWDAVDGVLDLGTFGGSTSEAYDINDLGQVVGYAARADGTHRPFLWDRANGMRDLVALTNPGNTSGGWATAINDAGTVFVYLWSDGSFLWDAERGLQGPFLQGSQVLRYCRGWAINESNQVVGWSGLGEGWAFYWDATHGVIDLNSVLPQGSGWRLIEATDINDQGQIVGFGWLDGAMHGYLLNLALNSPPVASAGPDQTVETGTLVTLSAANSTDPDGPQDIASHQWEQTTGPAVTLSDPTVSAPAFTAPEVGPEGALLGFRLTVRDQGGLGSAASCTVTVTWFNQPPVANAGPDQTVSEGQWVQLDGSGSSDPDDGQTSHAWRQTDGPTVTLSDPGSANPTFTAPDVGPNGIALVFELTVTDQHGLQATDTCIVNVTWVNAPPVARAGADQTVAERTTVLLDGSASSDPDDGIAAYQWTQLSGPPVTLSDPTIAQPAFLAPDVGYGGATLALKLQVTDHAGLKSEAQCTVSVLWVNTLPTVDAGENLTISSIDQSPTTLPGTASDADADPLTFRWTEGGTVLSGWAPVGADGAAPLPLAAVPPLPIGTHTLTLEVDDGYDLARDDLFLTIENSPPHAAPTGEGTYQVNTPITLAGQVSDYDGDWVTYEWLDGQMVLGGGTLPTGAEGSPVDLPPLVVFSLSVGTHTIALLVSDGVNPPVTKAFPLNVIDTIAPTLAPVASQTLLWPPNHQMVAVVISANASDNSGGPVSLRATIASNEPENGLGDGDLAPDWTAPAMDAAAGNITLQLRAERSGRGNGRQYTVTVTATDPEGNSSTANVKILVPHDQKKK